MAENIQEILNKLFEISALDLRFSRALSEKNKITEELKKREQKHKDLTSFLQSKEKSKAEKLNVVAQQQKHLSAEQDKLKERRKSITTISDYKIQEKAEKEIEHAAKQLAMMEDKVLDDMEAAEDLGKDVEKASTDLAAYQQEFTSYRDGIAEALAAFEKTMTEAEESKKALTSGMDIKLLSAYRRISEKFPGTAMVAVNGNSCGGCYFTLGPQVLVQVSRAQQFVNCPSCGRILFLKKEKAEEVTG